MHDLRDLRVTEVMKLHDGQAPMKKVYPKLLLTQSMSMRAVSSAIKTTPIYKATPIVTCLSHTPLLTVKIAQNGGRKETK